mmetsp:Transcript_12844/g.32393  ORF Transcript_12844/g.32393 Transcript_12844/m.32393 type:complete len:309 (-) Transcript_12844:5791-6717(-)
MPASTCMRNRQTYRSFLRGLKAIVILTGSNRCSSDCCLACGRAGVTGNHRGILTSESSDSTSFDGPLNSPSQTSKMKASRSSMALASRTSSDCCDVFFRATCINCHLASTFVMFSSRITRLRVRELSTWTRPNSTITGPDGSPGCCTSRSKSACGTAMARTAGRLDVATRCIRCKSVGMSGKSSEASRGYSAIKLPLKTWSIWVCTQSDDGTSSGTNSTCKVTVSSLPTTNTWRHGSCGTIFDFLRVLLDVSTNFTGNRPTWLISMMRNGPSILNLQEILHALRLVSVTCRMRQDTIPGICAPRGAPP